MSSKNKSTKVTPSVAVITSAMPAQHNTNIVEATASYEAWLSQQTNVVSVDLVHKHQQMAVSAFILLRATFYRFAEQWQTVSGTANTAPIVLGVGDLHIENFGTWRDSEGRLVWGVNDFDETCYAPFALDLVRLATSAILAINENHLTLSPERACQEILVGYKESLKVGGQPFVLAEGHSLLRDMAVQCLKKPSDYWQKISALPRQLDPPSVSATECIERLMPERGLPYKLVHRVAGEGSLGRPRYTGIAEWRGGYVARDVKAMLPSAWQWAGNQSGPYEILYSVAVGRAIRCRDPIVHSTGQWIGRRIAPDCSRIELVNLAPEKGEAYLLSCMGWETANIHLGTPGKTDDIRKWLKQANKDWLLEAAQAYVTAIYQDFDIWKQHLQGSGPAPTS